MRRPLALGLAALALGAAGCGGDEEEPTLPSAPELTVPQQKNGPEPADTETTDETTTDETTTDGATTTGAADPGQGSAPGGAAERPDGFSPGNGSGNGSGGGSGGGRPDPSKPDSPENDTPPPPGSPEEAFEQECERDPEACG